MFPDGTFPGYPGPIDPKRGIRNVAYPALPRLPGRPAYPANPGLAGGPGAPDWAALALAQGALGLPMAAAQAQPQAALGLPTDAEQGPAADPAAANPLAGLQAYGVPVGVSPTGQPMVRAGMANGFQVPPELPGMPPIPGPPAGLFDGGMGGGGLFQPVPTVAPFDHGNRVWQLQAQQGQR